MLYWQTLITTVTLVDNFTIRKRTWNGDLAAIHNGSFIKKF